MDIISYMRKNGGYASLKDLKNAAMQTRDIRKLHGLLKTMPITSTLAIIVALPASMFTNLKFVHPTRPQRWNVVTLPVSLAWTFFAGWAAWVGFHPQSWAHWGLIVTSLYLALAGIAQQIIPERTRRRG